MPALPADRVGIRPVSALILVSFARRSTATTPASVVGCVVASFQSISLAASRTAPHRTAARRVSDDLP